VCEGQGLAPVWLAFRDRRSRADRQREIERED
jgi:hypothetical protein